MNQPLRKIGNYKLLGSIGRGGFAEVFQGEHIYLETLAAIKILQTSLSEQAAEAFRREAQTIARLKHPYIIGVLEFGVDQRVPFLVMEYAPYGSLRDLHPSGIRVPLPAVISYVKQISSALQYAHQERVVHCDVKPGNILLGIDNRLLLGDFGISTIAHATASMTTLDRMGTPIYMAPEACIGKPRPASDQYSLAIMVYEWLTGEPPFQGNPFQVMHQQTSIPPQPLREKNPAISPEVEEVVLRALEKDYHKRFPTMQDFADALEHAAFPKQSLLQPRVAEVPAAPKQRPIFPSEPVSSQFTAAQQYTVLDIGTQSVRTALIEVFPGRVVVVGNGQAVQASSAMDSSDIVDLHPVIESCKSALTQAELHAERAFAPRAVVGLSSSLLEGQVFTFEKQRSDPARRITQEETMELIQHILQQLYEQARRTISAGNGQGMEIPIQLIDCMPLQVMIDGVSITNPVGFQGRNFSLSLFGAFMPQPQFQAFATVLRSLNLTFYTYVEQLTALCRVLLRYTDLPADALIVDIGAGTTKIAQIRKKRMHSLKVLPTGGRLFTQLLTQSEGLSWEEAEQAKRRYGAGTLINEPLAPYQQTFEKGAQQWREQLEQTLQVLAGGEPLPTHLYLCGGGAKLPEVLATLKNAAWQKQAPFLTPPSIELLTLPHRLYTLAPSDIERETNLLLLATAYEMYQDTATVNTIMHHLIQEVIVNHQF